MRIAINKQLINLPCISLQAYQKQQPFDYKASYDFPIALNQSACEMHQRMQNLYAMQHILHWQSPSIHKRAFFVLYRNHKYSRDRLCLLNQKYCYNLYISHGDVASILILNSDFSHHKYQLYYNTIRFSTFQSKIMKFQNSLLYNNIILCTY